MHLEKSETSSKYFFNKEKSLAKTKCIRALDCNNKVITDPKEILLEQKYYYEELYKEKNIDSESEVQEATKHFMGQANISKLEENEKDNLDTSITIDELTNAIKELPNNKTPGIDGLTAEFYKFIWSKITTAGSTASKLRKCH